MRPRRRSNIVVATAVMALLACVAEAAAQRAPAPRNQVAVDVGGRLIRLIVPAGQCRLDPRQTFDGGLLNGVLRALSGTNELLLYAANCDDLAAARSGRALQLFEFSQAQVSRDFRRRELRGQETTAAKEICQALRSSGDQAQEALGSADERVSRLQGGLAANETKSLGVLGEDQHGCYAGIINRSEAQTGDVRIVVSVFAQSVLNGRLIYLYRYKVNPKPGDVDQMVGVVKEWAREHALINNRPAPQRR